MDRQGDGLGRPSFADRLTSLIEAGKTSGEHPHSYREMSSAIERAGGPAMSPAYIQQLATGKRINPKIHYVEALANLFGVPVNYFFDESGQERATGGQEAQLMAMRAAELSPEGRRQVMDLLALVERYEQSERDKQRGGGRTGP
jgi:transcriptional regulator with XRE-family HTH domain